MGENHWGHPSMGVTCHWGNNTLEYYYGSEVPVGDWYNFAITTDSSGTRICLDGELKASNTNYIDNTYVNGKILTLGVAVGPYGNSIDTDGNVGYFKGFMDDVFIYDRALSNSELQELYALQVVPAPGAALLGIIGLGIANRWLRRRETA